MDHFVRNFYRLLMVLSGISMVAAFVIVILGVISREVPFIAINGLDAYAGYAIAAALFFALPTTLVNGDHIRVT
ncbi:MAG: TRAP transporter small permease, partial [Burkholderiales bacterium]|nr:TRAP transporter small permease [Burkholderiales bacterium]